MTVEKAKIKTAKLIAYERTEMTVFHYTLLCLGIGVAVVGTNILLSLAAATVLPIWASIVVAIPFAVLFGIWKNKIVEHGAKRMLEELQVEEGHVVRDLSKPF